LNITQIETTKEWIILFLPLSYSLFFPRSQTVCGSLVETFEPNIQCYMRSIFNFQIQILQYSFLTNNRYP